MFSSPSRFANCNKYQIISTSRKRVFCFVFFLFCFSHEVNFTEDTEMFLTRHLDLLTVCSMALKPFCHHTWAQLVLMDDGNSWMKFERKRLSSPVPFKGRSTEYKFLTIHCSWLHEFLLRANNKMFLVTLKGGLLLRGLCYLGITLCWDIHGSPVRLNFAYTCVLSFALRHLSLKIHSNIWWILYKPCSIGLFSFGLSNRLFI